MAVPGHPGRPTFASVALGVAIVVSGALVACAGPQQSPGGSGATGAPIDPASARHAIEAAKLDDADSLVAVARFRFTKAGGEAARQVLAAGGSTDVLWAAVWVYGSAAADPVPLKPLLQHVDPSLRVMAAAMVIASGDRDGFAVLRAALGDDSALAGSDPPLAISGFAAGTLVQYVHGTSAPTAPQDEGQLAAAVTAWPAWLDGHAATLVFDQVNGTWSAP